MARAHGYPAHDDEQKNRGYGLAYAVDKKSTFHGQQTTAEACAKHLEAHMNGKE